MNAKKLICLALSVVMMLALFAPSAFAEGTDQTLNITMPSEPSALWGQAVGKNENESLTIIGALTDRLVNVNYETGEVLPSLATAWEWVDPTHVRLTLRDDVTMTDGTPLVADDVVYCVEKVWMERCASNDTGSFLAGAAAEDEHTVVIEFNCVAPDLLAMLAWSCFGIVSEDEVNALGGLDEAANNPVVGSGKYRFKEWKRGQYVTVERNDNYWDKEWSGYFKTIVFTFTPDAAARVLAVESGDAQIAYDLPGNQAMTYAGRTDLNTLVYSFGQVSHIWYNMGDKAGATKDVRVRQAIDLAMNFDAIAMVASGNSAQPSLGYFEPNSKYYNETYTAEERAVNVDAAKELLAEAGYADGLELHAVCLGNLVNTWTVVQGCLQQIGIKLVIDTPDTPQFVQSAFGGDYDMILVGEYVAARYPTLFCFLRTNNIYGSGLVIGGPKWTTDEIDAKIQAFIEEADEAKAKELGAEIEQIMKDQCIVSNLCPEMKSSILCEGLQGYTTYERGYIDATNFYFE